MKRLTLYKEGLEVTHVEVDDDTNIDIKISYKEDKFIW